MRKQLISPVEKMLGQVLVERNMISTMQLEQALDRQKKEKGRYKYIGEILIEMNVSQERIREALEILDKRKPLGEILVDLKMITPEQLSKALSKQTQLANLGIRKQLGKLLISMGFIAQNEYTEALSKHFNLPIISLRGGFPSLEMQKVIGEAYAQKHRIIVLENYPSRIKIAVSEPNPMVMDELKRTFPVEKKVEFYLAKPSEIDLCLKKKLDPFSINNYR
jgi:type IV pilus assembly protein PilB